MPRRIDLPQAKHGHAGDPYMRGFIDDFTAERDNKWLAD
jgi:hypothetical protein